MKLVRFTEQERVVPGLFQEEIGVIRSLAPLGPRLGEPDHIFDLLAVAENVAAEDLPIVSVKTLTAPVAPRKIVAVGLNYTDHAKEVGLPAPLEPQIFLKADTSLSGPTEPVVSPPGSEKLDWEVELAIVIGRTCKYVNETGALMHVAGYCLAIDVSERAFQFERGGTIDKGKSSDGFCPLGPFLVPSQEVADPQSLEMTLSVNGSVMQSGSTRNMIFSCATIISYVSQFMTLRPSDVILTGTPAGVGFGRSPQLFLKRGDIIEATIDGFGRQQHLVT